MSTNKTWYLRVEETNQTIRGPFEYAETAAAVRSEIEYFTNTNANLIIFWKAEEEPCGPPPFEERERRFQERR